MTMKKSHEMTMTFYRLNKKTHFLLELMIVYKWSKSYLDKSYDLVLKLTYVDNEALINTVIDFMLLLPVNLRSVK